MAADGSHAQFGLLQALAGEFTALRPWLADEAQLATLEKLLAMLAPRLRTPVQSTSSPRRLPCSPGTARKASNGLTRSGRATLRTWI